MLAFLKCSLTNKIISNGLGFRRELFGEKRQRGAFLSLLTFISYLPQVELVWVPLPSSIMTTLEN